MCELLLYMGGGYRNYKFYECLMNTETINLSSLSTLLPNRLPKGWPRSSLHVREGVGLHVRVGVGLHDREGVGHQVFDHLIINNVNINNRENQDKHKHKEYWVAVVRTSRATFLWSEIETKVTNFRTAA